MPAEKLPTEGRLRCLLKRDYWNAAGVIVLPVLADS